MKVLAGDIGGTRIRLAVIEVRDHQPDSVSEQTFQSKDYNSLEEALEQFVGAVGLDFDSACFGVAGPVLNNRCITTNLPWNVDGAKLEAILSGRKVSLINDLAANAAGLQALAESDFFVINPGNPNASGNACILAAGTGLGEAGMFWDGGRHRPFATEGGHCDFAPACDLDFRLQRFLAERHGHVSWERVVSGMGIVNLFEFLCEEKSKPQPDWFLREKEHGDAASAVSAAAMSAEDPLCLEAMQLFLRYYGAEAGNLALKTLARAGVYLGGGIAPKILPLFPQSGFLKAFLGKGRMQDLLREMPVKVVLNERTALLGAALQASLME